MDAFLADLAGIPHSRDAAALRVKSADFSWFSPIMSAALGGRLADVVVSPRNEEDVLRIAAACAKHRMPLVARGGGTGNFGQAVPLAGGAVVEMTALDKIVFQRSHVARAQAGIRLVKLDEELRKNGQELRMHPSTKKLSTGCEARLMPWAARCWPIAPGRPVKARRCRCCDMRAPSLTG